MQLVFAPWAENNKLKVRQMIKTIRLTMLMCWNNSGFVLLAIWLSFYLFLFIWFNAAKWAIKHYYSKTRWYQFSFLLFLMFFFFFFSFLSFYLFIFGHKRPQFLKIRIVKAKIYVVFVIMTIVSNLRGLAKTRNLPVFTQSCLEICYCVATVSRSWAILPSLNVLLNF